MLGGHGDDGSVINVGGGLWGEDAGKGAAMRVGGAGGRTTRGVEMEIAAGDGWIGGGSAGVWEADFSAADSANAELESRRDSS